MKITFIHAPAYYDFRLKKTFYGPISDVIPSSPVFDMYPLGIASLATHIYSAGFDVDILNLAALMLLDPNYDVERKIRSLKTDIVGIDLHWLVHANGALKIANLVKKYHPDLPIIFGGLSSSYFWRELIEFPQVDMIMRGDTTEGPMIELMKQLTKDDSNLDKIPNLVWKDKNGEVHKNPLSYVPRKVPLIDYELLGTAAFRRNWKEWLPYASFVEAPIMAVFTIKGCVYNCCSCGGSNYAYKTYYSRPYLARKKPEDVLKEIRTITNYTKISIFFVGDLRISGYADKIIHLLREEKIDNPLIFEFFYPPNKEFLKQLEKTSERVLLQISPESHDDQVRFAFGRPYSTSSLLKSIKYASEMNFERFDLYFMIGLPKQDISSAIDSARFAGKLIDKQIDTFIAPLAPFIDPGSAIFDNPEKYGYTLLFKDLKSHAQAFENDDWIDFLNYETKWMSREDIRVATNKALLILHQMKMEKGKITEKEFEKIRVAIENESENKVDHIAVDVRKLYPTRNLYSLIKINPKTLAFFAKLGLKKLLH